MPTRADQNEYASTASYIKPYAYQGCRREGWSHLALPNFSVALSGFSVSSNASMPGPDTPAGLSAALTVGRTAKGWAALARPSPYGGDGTALPGTV
jgi:hypothetical protein